jgi:hypothetical protein
LPEQLLTEAGCHRDAVVAADPAYGHPLLWR